MKAAFSEEDIQAFLGASPPAEGWLEGAWQWFRKQHGIGDGIANRKKFIRILPRALDEVMARN